MSWACSQLKWVIGCNMVSCSRSLLKDMAGNFMCEEVWHRRDMKTMSLAS